MDIVKDPKLLFVALLVIFFIGATIKTADNSISSLGRENQESGLVLGVSENNNSDADSIEILFADNGNISPYADKVILKRANAKDDDPREEYLELRADRKNEQVINITGWTLESLESGRVVTIDTVTKIPVYRGTNTSNADVLLEPNQSAYIVSGGSPIGTSFRTNECIGYLEQNKTFSPHLPRECPDPEDEDLDAFGIDSTPRKNSNDEMCLREIKSISVCKNPGKPDEDLSNDCREYINSIDYNWCTQLHVADEHFLGTEWYVYANNKFNDIWDDENDTIELRDNKGMLVDTIDY